MNFPENAPQSENLEQSIQSLQYWWSLSGVDHDYQPLPAPLLMAEKNPVRQAASASLETPTPPIVKQNVSENVQVDLAKEDFPDDGPAFLDWLKESSNLLESSWTKDLVYPEGNLTPQMMVVTAMPEASGISKSQYLSVNETKLLKNMLSAINIGWEDSFRAALSLGRTIDGRLSKSQVQSLLKRTRHMISLVQPKQIIFFGDTLSRAFFDEDLLSARKKKQFINHVSSKTEAIVTFHPRILLERPELKAEAWKDLQMLTRIATQ